MYPILFIGEYWQGSCARSLCEALVRQGSLVEEIHETMFFPKWRSYPLRGTLRLLNRFIQRDIEEEIIAKLQLMGTSIVVVYKGSQISNQMLEHIKEIGSYTVNVYPDCSPISHGNLLKKAMGKYDLVVSTKSWHPAAWRSQFGYQNRCVFVPQGYDPLLHYQEINADLEQPIDVLMVATYRMEYGDIIRGLSLETDLHDLHFVIHGAGWERSGIYVPKRWTLAPAVHGHAYRKRVSQAKVCIAPVTRDVVVDGKQYPGDEDTTRTYELPAMGAYFIHRRTEYVQTLFDETTEVPMFDTAQELADHIRSALNNPAQRLAMRRAAQQRAVTRDALDQRAIELQKVLEAEFPSTSLNSR